MPGLRREDALPLIAGLPALALFAWWAADDGGYFIVQWAPGAVALAWLLVAVVVMPGVMRRPSRATCAALAALAAYTAWSFISIAWADVPGVALEGSERTLLYLECFATFALAPWTPRAAVVALVTFIAAVTVLGVVTLIRATAAPPSAGVFYDGRLIAPFGYQNAVAALWTMAGVTALALVASRALPAPARPLLLAASGFLLGLAVLAQSRGWLYTLPVVAIAALALARGPARPLLVVYSAAVGGAIALALPRLLHPYDVAGARPREEVVGRLHDAIAPAAHALALVAVGLLVAGALLVWVEHLVTTGARRSPRATTVLRYGGTAVVAGVIVAALASSLVATHGHPVGKARSAWADFKDFKSGSGVGGNRFADLSSIRYDFWRVGVHEWRKHPLAGLGQDNFAAQYVRERSVPYTEARWTHSIELRALVHTGLIGAVLLLAFFVAAGIAALRTPPGAPRRLGAVALLPAVVWLAHGSVDWLWEFPGLGGPALAFAAMAASLATADDVPRARRGRTATAVAAPVLAIAACVVVIPGYISERDVRSALAQWRGHPAAALKRLDRAEDLNPLAARPPLVKGLIAAELGRADLARAEFHKAARRDSGAWVAPFEIGLLDSASGNRAGAATEFGFARARNPLGGTIALAQRRLRGSHPMTRAQAAAAIATESARQRGAFGAEP